MPTVSVIIPTYNRWPHIETAIASVLAQQLAAGESVDCVVVDDASTDGTPERLLATYGGRIQMVRMPVNSGPAAARNAGIRQAAGEFICMLDSDDVLLPGSLASRLRLFREDPGFDGVAWGPRLRPGHVASELAAWCARLPAGRDFALAYLQEAFLATDNYLVRRHHLLALAGGPYRGSLTNNEDVELFLRLLARLPFRFCGCCVAEMRRVDTGLHRNYPRILQQGMCLIDYLRSDPAVVAMLGPALDRFEHLKLVEWAGYAARIDCPEAFFRYSRHAWRRSWWRSLCSLKLWKNTVRMTMRRLVKAGAGR